MRAIHHILVTVAVCAIIVACSTTRRTERHDYLQSRGVELRVDTTRTTYAIEVINEYHRDTVVRTIYRESGTEHRGLTTLTDTVYIHKTDTVYQVTVHAATEAGTVPWWLVVGSILLLVLWIFVFVWIMNRIIT